ncbi:MAG: hypothetical protein GY702_02895 [Desulfobulbaceae bacterium]|nr:hypothetical protein [Desulfobulbaceae bacterium]
MQSLTYKDIIDEKISEWQSNIKNLEGQAEKASADSKIQRSAKIEVLNSAIEEAVIKLRALDAQETVGNTLVTKDRILEIFNSIDKDFVGIEMKTPFML